MEVAESMQFCPHRVVFFFVSFILISFLWTFVITYIGAVFDPVCFALKAGCASKPPDGPVWATLMNSRLQSDE